MENSSMINNTQAMMEYLLNKYVPYLILLGCLYFSLGLFDIMFYIILCAVLFIDRHSFLIGKSHGIYEVDPKFRKHVDDSIDD